MTQTDQMDWQIVALFCQETIVMELLMSFTFCHHWKRGEKQ